jgi:GntR family transcriptional regulator/MocR family aminotransferase
MIPQSILNIPLKEPIAHEARDQSGVTRRQQVYEQLRLAIENGALARAADCRPRATMRAPGVSRNTLLWAMERLQAEGYVMARVGDGSYVSAKLAAPAGPAP